MDVNCSNFVDDNSERSLFGVTTLFQRYPSQNITVLYKAFLLIVKICLHFSNVDWDSYEGQNGSSDMKRKLVKEGRSVMEWRGEPGLESNGECYVFVNENIELDEI